jgi:hypothetical protein
MNRIDISFPKVAFVYSIAAHNAGLQLRRAISIQAEGKKLLEKHCRAVSCKALLN